MTPIMIEALTETAFYLLLFGMAWAATVKRRRRPMARFSRRKKRHGCMEASTGKANGR